jgi:hypothetical protein
LNRDDGGEATFRKVSGLDSLVWLFQMLPKSEGHGFEVRLKQFEVIL